MIIDILQEILTTTKVAMWPKIPKFLYLGQIEHDALCQAFLAELGAAAKDCDSNGNESERIEWCGCKVYKVDSKSHIAFS